MKRRTRRSPDPPLLHPQVHAPATLRTLPCQRSTAAALASDAFHATREIGITDSEARRCFPPLCHRKRRSNENVRAQRNQKQRHQRMRHQQQLQSRETRPQRNSARVPKRTVAHLPSLQLLPPLRLPPLPLRLRVVPLLKPLIQGASRCCLPPHPSTWILWSSRRFLLMLRALFLRASSCCWLHSLRCVVACPSPPVHRRPLAL